ncbi:MAG TPA: LON peptidase substrate-binding domain-containing protein, partial [Polyangiaceae bacterium]
MSELRGGASAPKSLFPLLPLRTGVLFPGTMITLPVGRKRSVALVESLHSGDVIGVVTQREPKIVDPTGDDLYDTGTFARVVE